MSCLDEVDLLDCLKIFDEDSRWNAKRIINNAFAFCANREVAMALARSANKYKVQLDWTRILVSTAKRNNEIILLWALETINRLGIKNCDMQIVGNNLAMSCYTECIKRK